ncbi:MAG: hypothetical protein ACSLFI_04090, partial [Solirubrobacterales bacterium]
SCPVGDLSTIPTHEPVGPNALLGLAAAGGITRGNVSYFDLDTFCRSTPKGVGGTWTGSYRSTVYPRVRGTFRMTLTVRKKVPSNFTGIIRIAGSDCVANGSLSGSVNGSQIRFGVVNAQRRIGYTGTVERNSMAGSFTAPGCGDDAGTWQARRAG